MRHTLLRPSLPVLAAVLVGLSLAGCASGPSDFMRTASEKPTQEKPFIRDADEQAALAAALAAQSRGAGVPAADPSTAMALSVVRQQQNEEAQALLKETETAFRPAAPICDPLSADPALACPVKAP